MGSSKENGMDAVARLRQVLDVAGARPARWPAAERSGLERLIARDPEARRLLAEARAMDRLLTLGQSHQVSITEDAIERTLSRVLTAATVKPVAAMQAGRPAATIVPFPRRRPAGFGRNFAGQLGWQAGALMAACLLAGVFIGPTSPVAPVLEEAAEQLGITTISAEPVQGLFGDELQDEDPL